MTKTQRDQNEELIRITIQMDKDIDTLNKMLSRQGKIAGRAFAEAIECLMDAKTEIEAHTNNIRKPVASTCQHHDVWVD